MFPPNGVVDVTAAAAAPLLPPSVLGAGTYAEHGLTLGIAAPSLGGSAAGPLGAAVSGAGVAAPNGTAASVLFFPALPFASPLFLDSLGLFPIRVPMLLSRAPALL